MSKATWSIINDTQSGWAATNSNTCRSKSTNESGDPMSELYPRVVVMSIMVDMIIFNAI